MVVIGPSRAKSSPMRAAEEEFGPRRRRAQLVRVREVALRPQRALGIEMQGWDSLTGDV